MMRTWKMLGLNTLLAASLAAAPGLGSSSSSDADKLQEIQTQLKELKKAVTGLEDRIKEARSDSAAGGQRVQNQIKDLNDQLSLLRLEVENLRTRLPAAGRSSAYSPSSDGGPVPTPATARVEMINTYSQPVSIVINNRRSYLLAPGERRLSDAIPAGAFTYEVLGIQPAVTRTVAVERTFTVWVHPQP